MRDRSTFRSSHFYVTINQPIKARVGINLAPDLTSANKHEYHHHAKTIAINRSCHQEGDTLCCFDGTPLDPRGLAQKYMEHSCSSIQKLTMVRQLWRSFVAALCTSGSRQAVSDQLYDKFNCY